MASSPQMNGKILVNGWFYSVIASPAHSGVNSAPALPQAREAICLKPRDCFGKKRLAMTAILALNEYSFVKFEANEFEISIYKFGKKSRLFLKIEKKLP
jgi:hypothetical protein